MCKIDFIFVLWGLELGFLLLIRLYKLIYRYKLLRVMTEK